MDATTTATTTHPTLVLTRADVARLMTAQDHLAAAEEAFRALAAGSASVPAPLHIGCEGGTVHAKGARLDAGDGAYVALKVNANFPANPKAFGLPTIQGAIILSDAHNGALLAILDSIEITLKRTAAATALAAAHLARPNAATLALCGCGRQAHAQLEALEQQFAFARVFAWDADHAAALSFARQHANVEPVNDMRDATLNADIIVTCTTARVPFLDVADVRPGTFIAAVGADNPDKGEIAPALMAKAKVVVDAIDQCRLMGDLHNALAAGAMRAEDVHASLGELVLAQRPARANAHEITIFDSTGTAVQDAAAAVRVYRRARALGVGLALNLND